jgi:Caspase domain
MTSTGIDYQASRVILLGTSAYNNSRLDAVPAVEHSMQGMYAMLTSPRHGGWPKDRVEYWLNRRNAGAVAKDLRDLATATQGVFIFYFVGHGTMTEDEDEQLCLMLPDTTDDNPDLTGLEYRMVSRALGRSNAQTKMLILDCCYADSAIGHMAGAGAPMLESTPGTYTLTATNPLQQRARWSGRDDRTPTAFTGELLSLIRAGKDGGPERLSLNDFYPSLRQRLIGLALPKPSNKASDMAAHQPFTLNAASPSPDGAAITPPPFFAPPVLGSPGTGGPLRALAAGLLPLSAAGAFFRRATPRYSRLAPRTRRTALASVVALSLTAAAFVGYALNPGTSTPAYSTADPNVRLSTVYGTGLGTGSSYPLLPNIHADQSFLANQPYIDEVGVVVGLDETLARVPTHTLEIQVLNSAGTVLGDGCAPLNNNKNTVVTFSDIRTDPHQVYRFRVTNRSDDPLGIYIDKAGPESNNVGVASINGIPQQQGIIAGFVEGRNKPTQGAQVHSKCAG